MWQELDPEFVASRIPFLPAGTRIKLVAELNILAPVEVKNWGYYQSLGFSKESLDLENAIFIGLGERDGDDVWLALDYRRDLLSPSVVCSDIVKGKVVFREIAHNFEAFVSTLMLV